MLDEMAVRRMLSITLQRPFMWAATREAYVARLSTLLDVLGHDGRQLYRALPHDGPVLLDPGTPLDAEWAKILAEHTHQILEGAS